MIKTQIEDQQLTGKVDLGTTWVLRREFWHNRRVSRRAEQQPLSPLNTFGKRLRGCVVNSNARRRIARASNGSGPASNVKTHG
jgi:hypothetical protein